MTPASFFLKRAKVELTDGSDCGEGGPGFARLNFATSQTLLRRIVERMGMVNQA